MAASLPAPDSVHGRPALLRIRAHAALVRALLDELDRIVPTADGGRELALEGQLVEELAHLGSRISEYATTMSRPSDWAPRAAVEPEGRARTSGSKGKPG